MKQARQVHMLRVFVILGLFLMGQTCYAAGMEQTARSVFALLPPSIFENTPEGLTEADKQSLLNTGSSEFWEIAGETEDVLVFAELPFRDRAVALRLFPNEKTGGKEAAVGTLGDEICTVELWHVDSSGRIMPSETPPEPAYEEFFKRRPPKGYGQSVLLCLGLGGLAAKPMIWDKNGVRKTKTDFDISYIWDGCKFVKQVRPAQPEKE